MPELGTYGSVRGVLSNGHPYRDSSGHPAPSAQHGRRAVLALKMARATVAMERRDGLACFAQVKEERPIVRLGSGDMEQNTPARRGALAQSIERLH